MTEEIWKKIPEYDKYEVSNKERIRNIGSGRVREFKDVGCKRIKIDEKNIGFNRLVALVFVPNLENLPYVLHIKGKSNIPENLRWGKKGEESNNKNIIKKERDVVPIERLDDEGNVLETYNDRESIVKWIRDNYKTKGKDISIKNRIAGACNSNQNIAYGYKWRYEFKEIEGEEWKKSPDFEKYEFSTMGRCRDGTRLLVGTPNKAGYIIVIHQLLNRLIAKTFTPNPNNLPQVDHINEDKTDNRVCNLRWSTAKDNTKHSLDKQIYQYTKDSKTFIRKYESFTVAGEETDVHKDSISKCALGKYKSAGGYYWTYVKLD